MTCISWLNPHTRLLVSGSADGTLIMWNTLTGERYRRLRGHRGIINDIACTRAGNGCFASASDDGRVLFWDAESRYPVDSLEFGYPITCIEFSDDASLLFVGGVDNAIHAMDLATKNRQYSLLGHKDTVASLALSHAGTRLVSSGLDDSVRVWDVQPFAAATPAQQPGAPQKSARLIRTLDGMASGFESLLIKARWSPDDEFVACGSADHTLNVWKYVNKHPSGCIFQADCVKR